jgi:hypothetical protein
VVDEGLEHGADLLAFGQQSGDSGGIKEVDFRGDLELGRDLGERPFRDEEKLGGFFVGLARLTLGDVAANADSGAAKLVAQTEIAIKRRRPGQAANGYGRRLAALPDK